MYFPIGSLPSTLFMYLSFLFCKMKDASLFWCLAGLKFETYFMDRLFRECKSLWGEKNPSMLWAACLTFGRLALGPSALLI
ncbi:hypothetical protein VNO77_00700 [Canavalia gladiata]|uniref:Uncharacterized protein n=1 Tax=Canavalia gladiata TaxID=3824 RepID=A0AAN9R4L9_CANGL